MSDLENDKNEGSSTPLGGMESPKEADDHTESKLHEAIEKRKHDAEALAQYTQEILEKKRAANAEAKQYREELESLREQIENEKREAQMKDMAESERLQAQYDASQQKIEKLEEALQNQLASEFELQIDHAVEKFGARDKDYVDFLLEKHLSKLDDDGLHDELADFNITEWMQDLKESKPDLFQTTQTTKANSGLSPTQASVQQNSPEVVSGVGKSSGDRAMLREQWQKFKTRLGADAMF